MTFKRDAEKLGMSIAARLHQLYQLTTSLFAVLVTSFLGFHWLLSGFIFNNGSPLLRQTSIDSSIFHLVFMAFSGVNKLDEDTGLMTEKSDKSALSRPLDRSEVVALFLWGAAWLLFFKHVEAN